MTPGAPPRRRFSYALRLHKPAEFEQVLRQRGGAGTRRRQHRGEWFAVSARINGLPHSRLGIIAARKVVARAVARNRLKRLIREVFRASHGDLPGLDIVVRVMAEAADAKARHAAREELIRLMLAVAK